MRDSIGAAARQNECVKVQQRDRMKGAVMKTDSTEDIILKYSARGMPVLRQYLAEHYCRQAAEEILTWPKGCVVLTTGFYVNGAAETDGPSGTAVVAKVLQGLGYRPVIVTDENCKGYFEPERIETVYLSMQADDDSCRTLLRNLNPVGMISIERCGKNVKEDYANMRGISIREHTAPCDRMFELCEVPTIGVGDGGNEIGMGNLKDVILEKLELTPCRIRTDRLVIATVSNWGAYGIASELEALTGKTVFSRIDGSHVTQFVEDFLQRTVDLGSVDGLSGERIVKVDGFERSVELEILSLLASKLKRNPRPDQSFQR